MLYLCIVIKRTIDMSEVELVLVNDTDKCTIYTIQFSEESETEYERFYSKFIKDAELNKDLLDRKSTRLNSSHWS